MLFINNGFITLSILNDKTSFIISYQPYIIRLVFDKNVRFNSLVVRKVEAKLAIFIEAVKCSALEIVIFKVQGVTQSNGPVPESLT